MIFMSDADVPSSFVCIVLFYFFERLSHCDDDVMSDECCIIFVRLCTSQ